MVGIDLVYIPEFEKQLKIGGDRFLVKAFNQKELKNQEMSHLAGLWAAKEAVIKALGNPELNMKDILITFSKKGQPQATLHGQTLDISIAHHGEYAVAVAQGGVI